MTRRRKRSPRRGQLDFDELVESNAGSIIWLVDDQRRREGYERSSARAWRSKNGTFTVRLVWRNRTDPIATVTWTVRGLTLA